MSAEKTPLILACDTTQGACSVALYKDGVIGHALLAMGKGHAEALIPMMDEVIATAGCDMRDIDRLAVTKGPGTFTGTRVGLSAMRGLALALQKPLKAYGTLAAMAQALAPDMPAIVAVDARRDVFYTQSFTAPQDGVRHPGGEPQALSADAAAALYDDRAAILAGSGKNAIAALRRAETHIDDGPDWPDAAQVAALAAQDGDWQNPPLPTPFYLRPPDATLPDRAKFPTRATPSEITSEATSEAGEPS